MDFIWILFAFTCGLGVKAFAMPPLIGYLMAGFALNYLGVEPTDSLQSLADIGITLMLFTIGLKLDPRSLLQTEVWASTIGHIGTWVAISVLFMVVLAAIAGLAVFSNLDLATISLLAFACCFSSTVCVIKLLEESGELKTRHGRLAVAILVMQDIVAVGFLVIATNKTPSLWAIALLLLIPARPLLHKLLLKAGHGELLPLTGFFLALGGYELFSLVNIKGDLGALIVGLLLSQYSKSAELSKALMSFKDLFLIGFFLSVGFTALPDWSTLWTALLLATLLPLKFFLFFLILVALKLRARSAFLTSLALSNFSEFGLIVAATSTASGWLSQEWIATLAVAVSISFVATTLLYQVAHSIYGNHKALFKRFERSKRLPQDIYFRPTHAEVLIIGMGRVGRGTYDSIKHTLGDRVWGMDADRERISQHKKRRRQVFIGDGEDADFWEYFDTSSIKMILLALPTIEDALHTTEQIRKVNYHGLIAAVARYDDDRERLLEGGVDKVFNFFTEAGTGFAEESLGAIGVKRQEMEAAAPASASASA